MAKTKKPKTVEQALLKDIRAHPDDLSYKLIYADWLEENNQEERAAFIRTFWNPPESVLPQAWVYAEPWDFTVLQEFPKDAPLAKRQVKAKRALHVFETFNSKGCLARFRSLQNPPSGYLAEVFCDPRRMALPFIDAYDWTKPPFALPAIVLPLVRVRRTLRHPHIGYTIEIEAPEPLRRLTQNETTAYRQRFEWGT